MLLKIKDAILSGLFVILIVFFVILALGVKDFPFSYNDTLMINQNPDGMRNVTEKQAN